MNAIIVSDLHLDSVFADPERFVKFIRTLPAGTALILNGDVIDNPLARLPDPARIALEEIIGESEQRRVIWIQGNHDMRFRPKRPGKVEFVGFFSIPGALHVSHGFKFMPFWRLADATLSVSNYLSAGGKRPLNVVRIIRRIPHAYSAMKNHLCQKAVRFARKNGFPVIICGHVHDACDITVNGTRYINTGAWTNRVAHYAQLDENTVSLGTFST